MDHQNGQTLPDLAGQEEDPLNSLWITNNYFPTSPNGSLTITAQQTNGLPLPDGITLINRNSIIPVGDITPVSFLGGPIASISPEYFYWTLESDALELYQLNPTGSTTFISELVIPLNTGLGDVICRSSLCYLLPLSGPDSLWIINVSQPLNSTLKQLFSALTDEISCLSIDIDPQNLMGAYVISNNLYVQPSFTSVILFDATGENRIPFGNLTLSTSEYFASGSIVLGNSWAIIPTINTHISPAPVLYIVNTTQSNKPTLVTTLSLPVFSSSINPAVVCCQNNLCAIGGFSSPGLLLLNISNPASPTLNPQTFFPNSVNHPFQFYDNFLFSQSLDTLMQINITNPNFPYLVNFNPLSCQYRIFMQSFLLCDTQVFTQGASFSFFGTPAGGTAGNYSLQIEATINNQKIGNPLTTVLEIMAAVTASASLPTQLVYVGEEFIYFLPSGTFESLTDQTLTYSATDMSGGPLPLGLSISPLTGTFSGISSQAGSFEILISATDSLGASASTSFLLISIYPIEALSSTLPNQQAIVGVPFSFSPGTTLFNNPNNFTLTYLLTSNGLPLPEWLIINQQTFSFSGIPSISSLGALPITIEANGLYGLSANVQFSIAIQTIVSPNIQSPLQDQSAFVDTLFSYTLPADLFTSTQGGIITITVGSLPSWVCYNSETLTFEGTPQISDQALIGQAQYQIPISARISFPNSTITASTITLLNINLVGNSQLDEALKDFGYSASALGALLLLYRYRRLYYTNYKKSYQKVSLDGVVGDPLEYSFAIEQTRIKKVMLLFHRSKPYGCCNPLRRWLTENLEGRDLPASGLTYKRIWNRVTTKKLLPFNNFIKVFYIRALGSGDVCLMELKINVTSKRSL